MVTSRDVARHAGVSQATVSRVLNGSGPVSPEVAQRVRAALDATGYVLNAQAKAMRTSRSGAIGLVTSDIRNPYFPYLLDELTRAANALGVRAIVWDDATDDARHAIDGLASGAVDGLVLTSSRVGSIDIETLQRRGAHFVLCNRAPADVAADVVMADSEAMTRTVAEYVLGAGRRRIAAIFGDPTSVATPFRRRGLATALDDAGLTIEPTLVRDGPTTYEAGRAAMLDLLDRGARIDTVFCTSDVLAYGAIDALRERGIGVPDDVWVTGVDGLPMSSWRAFDLTTVEQDVPEIARRTVRRLVDRIAGEEGPPVRDLVPAALVVRGSTAHH